MILAFSSVFFCLCWVTHLSMFLTVYVHIWKFSGRKFIITVIMWVVDLGHQGGALSECIS